MKQALFLLSLLFSNPINAVSVFDLEDPEHLNLAAKYKDYSFIMLSNFNDPVIELFDGVNTVMTLSKTPHNSSSDEQLEVNVLGITLLPDTGEQTFVLLVDENTATEHFKKQGLTIILNVTGQNIKFDGNCRVEVGCVYWPQTEAGKKYIVSTMSDNRVISIEGDGLSLLFDTAGFIEHWNSFGGDAL